MRKISSLISLFFALGLMSVYGQSTCVEVYKGRAAKRGVDDIRINQIGYLPKATKMVVVANSQASCFEVHDTTGKVVFAGSLENKGFWQPSNENIKRGDFSALQTPGSYEVWIADKGLSFTFDIKESVYDDMSKDALKVFYFQRASLELVEKYAGKFNRPLGQPDTVVKFHESTGRKPGQKSGTKGWYDAGDLNKYVVNAGVTVGTMYMVYDMYPALFPDNQVNIPESGNGVSDMLDELRWEMDWALTMQDEDGGVFVKISELDWEWAVMPHQWNDKERFFIGKSTSAALNLAAMCAMTARYFKTIDPAYAAKNLDAAKRAWKWSQDNDTVLYFGTPGVGSGNYPDANLEDEYFWAAAELYVTTGAAEYLTYLKKDYFDPKFEVCGWGTFMSNIGFYSLLTNDSKLPNDMKTKIKTGILKLANGMVDSVNIIPYSLPSQLFEWGSNSEMLNRIIIVGMAHKLTGEQKYLDAITRTMDYMLGENALGFSFVTGYGEYSAQYPHHRQCFADGIADPIPGFIVGGPNFKKEDDVNKHCPSCKTDYLKPWPATSYVDHFHSYASNEVTINWNASLIAVLNMIQAHKEKLK